MSSSTKAQAMKGSVSIADLFSKCSELAAEEMKEMARIISNMLPILAWLNEPVVLRPGSLGEAFSGFTNVSLQPGATVFTTDLVGKVFVRPLFDLPTKDRLEVMREAVPELQRLVTDKRRAAEVKPALSMKASLEGSRFIVDKRSYRVLVSNTGGDCRDLQVSIKLFGVKPKPSSPVSVNRGESVEVDLGVLKKEAGTMGRLELHMDCKDVDGRELRGDESLPIEGAGWQETVLTGRK